MREECVKNVVVYQATVSTEDHNLPQRTYVELTENSLKTSYLRAGQFVGLMFSHERNVV